jgi:hypothetical protein
VNRNFDFYEYAGFIIPGAVLVMAIVWLFPESRAAFSKEGVTLGEFGLFVIVAYAAGQLVQAIGNYFEWLWWRLLGGMPSGRVLSGKFLTGEQYRRLLEALRPALGDVDPSNISKVQRRAIAREVYTHVLGAGKAARVDTFNGSYGLMRRLAAAFIVLFVLAIVAGKGVPVLGTLVVLFLLALHRMHRYSQHYATELFTQFLVMKSATTDSGKADAAGT